MKDGSRTTRRIPPTAILAVLLLCGSAFGAESTSKISNTKGPDAPVVLGVITAVDGKVLTIRVPAIEAKQTIERKITLTEKTTISYLDIPDKTQQVPTVGYNIKGYAEEDRLLLKSAILSPPLGKIVNLGPERLTMSDDKLFAKADTNGDGKVSYGEFSASIEVSEKHGPHDFQTADKNKDGLLDIAEFVERMKSVTWWRLSRKSPHELFAQSDKDENGSLSMKEFSAIGAGHLDAVFPRYDKDNSGGLDEQEVTDYIKRAISE
jgi:Ca2+-binding EF-hand superfamily protein